VGSSSQILEQLFDSPLKVKLLRLFLRNPEEKFTLKEISKRTKSDSRQCIAQIKKLLNIDFLEAQVRKKRKVYFVNPNFDFYNELRTLVLKSPSASKKKILSKLKKIGKIKLAVLSGVFVNLENARADMLIVGNYIKKKKLTRLIKDLEAEVGKEIDYVIMGPEEFQYRYDMYDRFLRDILERPHEKLINKLKI